MPWSMIFLAALLLLPTAPRSAAVETFRLDLVSPDPLVLVGKCRIEAEARDASGRPFDQIAWMSLEIDGQPAAHDGTPPFIWDIDVGPGLKQHRVELTAVARDGSRASLALLSARNPYVESVGVELVLVPVVVREAGDGVQPGRVVTGLKAGDFRLLEEGTPRPIASFSDEPLPGSIAIALDTSRSMERHLMSAKIAVTEFIEQQPSGTSLSLMAFNDQVFLEQDFTTDRPKVLGSVAALRAEGQRTALNEAIRIGSLQLARRPGTRVLVVFTDGQDTLDEEGGTSLRRATDAAQQADVTVYAIAYALDDPGDLQEATAETGGETVRARGRGELSGAFSRISEALGSRYILAFEPPAASEEGYRNLEVRVLKEGVHVSARRGYRTGPTR